MSGRNLVVGLAMSPGLIERIDQYRRQHGDMSRSAVIRHAVENFFALSAKKVCNRSRNFPFNLNRKPHNGGHGQGLGHHR